MCGHLKCGKCGKKVTKGGNRENRKRKNRKRKRKRRMCTQFHSFCVNEKCLSSRNDSPKINRNRSWVQGNRSVEWSSWGGGNEKVRNQFPWISSLDSDIRMRFSSLCLRPHHHQWQWALSQAFLLILLFGREEDGESFVLMRLETR